MNKQQPRIEADNIKGTRYRRNKTKTSAGRYGMELSVTLTVGEDNEFCGRCESSYRTGANLDTAPMMEGLPYSRRRSYWHRHDQQCPKCHWSQLVRGITVHFYLPADRPKNILTESEAIKLIAKEAPDNADRGYGAHIERPLTLEQILTARFFACWESYQRDILRCKVAQQACSLGDHLATQTDKQARLNIKWEEKLEALKAELQAEQHRLLAENIKTLPQDCDKSEDDWHPEAIRLASERAGAIMPEAISSFLGRTPTPLVVMKDVVLDGDKPQDEPQKAEKEIEKVA